jgi:hypothetical protein
MSLVLQPLAFDLVLPWHTNAQREAAFKKTLNRVLIPVLLLFLLVPWLKLMDKVIVIENNKFIETKIILEPPPVIVQPVIPPKPVFTENVKNIDKPQSPAKADTAQKLKAGAKAKSTGNVGGHLKTDAPVIDKKTAFANTQEFTELSSQLKSLRGAVDIAKMQNKNVSVSTGGTVTASDRDVLGSDIAVGKGKGLVVDDAMMKGSVVALADHQSTSGYGVGQGSGNGSGRGGAGTGRGNGSGGSGNGNGSGGGSGDGHGDSQSGGLSNQVGGRDMESIRSTLEKAKSSVYTLYQRALLDHPNLAGKFTFSMVIEPNGSISKLKLVASELGLAELDASILDRIRQVNFGAKDASPTVVEYKFVFFPS